jgi:intracellular septation protein
MPLFSAIILGIFGSITIFSGNEIFIKMKPTLLNLLFALILFFGYFFKKPFLKYIFASKVELSEEAWILLSKRWGLFFIFLAVLNEIIWRNFTTDFWVKFKVFGILIISLIFTLTQLPYMLGSINKSDSKNHESKN